MTNSRRTFLASFVTWLTALPFVRAFTTRSKSFDFHVRIEEIGEERYRATMTCGNKRTIIESPIFDALTPPALYGHMGRIGLLFEVQRCMKIMAFPEDTHKWNHPVFHWFEPIPEVFEKWEMQLADTNYNYDHFKGSSIDDVRQRFKDTLSQRDNNIDKS